MHLVPIIPQPAIGVEESLEVAGVAADKAVKPVAERTLPPLLRYAQEQHASPFNVTNQPGKGMVAERRQLLRQDERRLVCRRIGQQDILEELRSAIDRRRHKRRANDLQLHIDEEA